MLLAALLPAVLPLVAVLLAAVLLAAVRLAALPLAAVPAEAGACGERAARSCPLGPMCKAEDFLHSRQFTRSGFKMFRSLPSSLVTYIPPGYGSNHSGVWCP